MKDVEFRLKNLEKPADAPPTEEQLQILKRPAMQDIEKRLIALESRPIETALSNVSFADDPSPTAMTTLIERIQVLESKVNNLEPSLSTLQSSISSAPLEPPEEIKKGEGSINDPSSTPLSTQESSIYKRNETLEAWVKSCSGGIPNPTLGFTVSELEGRLLKRITNLETQFTRLNVQELPNRQRELEVKVDKLLQTEELPSFGTSTSSKIPTPLELRLNKMEINQENLVSENKRLQARLSTLEESRRVTTIRQIMDRLDSVIRVVNEHQSESYQVGQSINDIQHELSTLRQAVDAWNEDEQQLETPIEEQQEQQHQNDIQLLLRFGR